MKRECSNCAHFVLNSKAAGGDHGHGTCHRYAPRPDARRNLTYWPDVRPEELCGEHSLRTDLDSLASTVAWGTIEHGEEHGRKLVLEALRRVALQRGDR